MPGVPALGFSLFLMALGAVLTWGVTATVSGLDLDAIGVILMIVGLCGIMLAMLFWTSWAPFNRRATTVGTITRQTTETDAPTRRTTTIERVDDERPLPPPAP